MEALGALAAGVPSGAVVVLHDVTELRRLERVRQDFVANVSHEFKTPLTAIQGFAETLLSGALEDPAHNRRFLQIIRDHAVNLARVTDDLLKLARIEAGKLEVQFGPVPGRGPRRWLHRDHALTRRTHRNRARKR